MLREFTDYSGVAWRVWDVSPQATHKPSKKGLRITPVEGWLVFESSNERRRLTPIPKDWETADVDGLSYLCARAKVVPRATQGNQRDASA